MKKPIFFLLLWCIAFCSFGQTSNPCFAEAISISCNSPLSGDTRSSGNNFQNEQYASCHSTQSSFNGGDAVYRVANNIPANSPVTITLNAGARDLDLFIFSCIDGSFQCFAKSTGNTGFESITISSWSSNYRIVVDGYRSQENGTYSLTVNCEESVNPCTASAINIGYRETLNGDTRSSGNNFGIDNYVNCHNSQSSFNGGDAVYRVTGNVPNNQEVIVELNATGRDLDLFIVQCVENTSRCIAKSTGSSGNEKITLSSWSSNYRIVVDGYRSQENGTYSLRVYDPCAEFLITDVCNLIAASYIGGSSGNLTYRFTVPTTTTSGSWTAQRVGSSTSFNLGSGRSRTYTFSTSGQYDICYTYTNSQGCEETCCRRIFIDNPYNCNQVTATKNGNTYRLSLGNTANSSDVQQWIDDSNGNIIGTETTTLDVPVPPEGCKWYSVWYYDVTTDCYRVCCVQVCGCDKIDNNCPLITSRYTGSGNNLTYNFSVSNNTPSGSWTAQRVGGNPFNLGSGRSRNYTFSTGGEYIICYKYTDNDGCEQTCCRRIFIENPYNCNNVTATKNGNSYRLSLGNTANSNNVEQWVDDSDGSTIATQTTTFDVPVPPEGCKWYSVWYYDVTTDCYRVCCVQVCGCDKIDNNCPLITSRYTGSGNNLTYNFSVSNNTPSGSWTAQRVGGNPFNLGSGRSRNYTFSTGGEYIICYKYTDNDGCEQTCCRRIFIENPYNCNNITATKNGNSYRLSLGNSVNSNNVEQWVDDSDGSTIATQTTTFDVPVPPEGCKWYSVWYYDVTTNCYRVCCVQVCGCDEMDNNCDLITYNYTGQGISLQYQFSVPSNTPSGSWTAQQAGGNVFNLASGPTTITATFDASGPGAYTICYKYIDNDGCEKTCCKQIYIENPYNCNFVTKTQIGNTYRLSLGNTATSNNVEKWVDDSDGSTIGTQTTTFDVPIPPSGECKWYSVWYYDVTTGCYRVCCIQICGGGCCPNGTATLDHLIDVFEKDCTDCGAEISCASYKGQPSYFVYSGFDCNDNCERRNYMVFDCNGQIQAVTTNFNNLAADLEIEDLLWECEDIPIPDCCAIDPTTLPWVQDYINSWCQNSCRGQVLYCSTFNGENVLHITPWATCSDGQGQIINCLGVVIETYGGIAGTPRPAGLVDTKWVWDATRCPLLLDSPTDKIVPTTTSSLLETAQTIRIANIPNPFSSHTDIAFELKEAVSATIAIFDSYGKKVVEQTGNWAKGKNIFRFETESQNTSGLYLVKIEGDNFTANHKILLVK